MHKYILTVLILISCLYSFGQIVLNLNNEIVSDSTDTLWYLIFSVIVAVWVNKEPEKVKFEAPFEFGAFVYFAWPLILPYYLVKTRGYEGVLVFIGFLGLYLMPFLSGLVAFVYLAG